MYREITEKLCCPICRNALILHEGETQNDEVISGKLRCSHGHEFFIRQGIVDFCSQE